MSKRTPVASLGRRLRARREPGPLTTRYECPLCGQDHPRAEHGAHDLDLNGVLELRRYVTDELLKAVRGGADADTLERMFALVDAIDARLDQVSERPSLEQRQRVADKGASRRTGGRRSDYYGADA